MRWPAEIRKILKQNLSPALKQAMKIVHRSIPYAHENPYLDGIFAPQRNERYSEHLKVEGVIPRELDGALMRIGPNPISVINPKLHHWFVGDGMLHALRIQNGKALWYKSQYVGANSVQKKLNRPSIIGKSRGAADAVNTNVIAYAGKIWALVEAGAYPIEVDNELNSKRQQLFENSHDLPFTAHPHIDPITGDIHAICYDALEQQKVFYLHLDAQGQLKHHVEIPVQHGPMIHDCAITQSHVLILDLCVNFSLKSVLKGVMLPYQWNPDHQARIGIMPFDGQASNVQWFDIDPCFIFHIANAYDIENGDIVMDAVVHSKAFEYSVQGPIEDQDIWLERFTFERVTGQVKREILLNLKQEFPRINERYTGRKHRYIYSVSFGEFDEPEKVKANQLLAFDTKTKQLQTYTYDDSTVFGEVIFVPKEKSKAENNGWLMAYVHALDCSPSKVVILDAQNIPVGPVATIELPVRVPLGFHCNWIDYQELLESQ